MRRRSRVARICPDLFELLENLSRQQGITMTESSDIIARRLRREGIL